MEGTHSSPKNPRNPVGCFKTAMLFPVSQRFKSIPKIPPQCCSCTKCGPSAIQKTKISHCNGLRQKDSETMGEVLENCQGGEKDHHPAEQTSSKTKSHPSCAAIDSRVMLLVQILLLYKSFCADSLIEFENRQNCVSHNTHILASGSRFPNNISSFSWL